APRTWSSRDTRARRTRAAGFVRSWFPAMPWLSVIPDRAGISVSIRRIVAAHAPRCTRWATILQKTLPYNPPWLSRDLQRPDLQQHAIAAAIHPMIPGRARIRAGRGRPRPLQWAEPERDGDRRRGGILENRRAPGQRGQPRVLVGGRYFFRGSGGRAWWNGWRRPRVQLRRGFHEDARGAPGPRRGGTRRAGAREPSRPAGVAAAKHRRPFDGDHAGRDGHARR